MGGRAASGSFDFGLRPSLRMTIFLETQRSGELLCRSFVRVSGLDGEDLVGFDGDGDGVAGYGEGCAFGFLHQVGFGGGGGSGWDVEFDLSGFAGPLVHAEDEGVGVFGFFDGGEDYVGVVDADEGVFGGK